MAERVRRQNRIEDAYLSEHGTPTPTLSGRSGIRGVLLEAYVAFKDEGTAPKFALRLMQVMGAQTAPA